MDQKKEDAKTVGEWAKEHAPKPPSNCPYCKGERELDGKGGAICHHCGRSTPTP